MSTIINQVQILFSENAVENSEDSSEKFVQLMRSHGRRLKIFTFLGVLVSVAGVLAWIFTDLFDDDEDTNEDNKIVPYPVNNAWGGWNSFGDLVAFYILASSLYNQNFSRTANTLKWISFRLGFGMRTFLHIWTSSWAMEQMYIMSHMTEWTIKDRYFGIAFLIVGVIIICVAFLFEALFLYGTLSKSTTTIQNYMAFRKFLYVLLSAQLVTYLVFYTKANLAVYVLGALAFEISYKIELAINQMIHDVVMLEDEE